MQIISGAKIFTGSSWLTDHEVMINNGKVEHLVPNGTYPFLQKKRFDNCYLVPAFIDVQVYGAGGKLFASYPEPETLVLMYEELCRQGTALFLPTLATNTTEVFKKGIDAVKAYQDNGGKGVYGLHLEGPWLNPHRRGAHVEQWIHPPTMAEVKELLAYGSDVIKMITVAPEVCSREILQHLVSESIIVSAGHSNATFEEASQSFDHGITAVTHLFNAMSPLTHRQPGLVGAAFLHPQVSASIIPDGHHVSYAAISIAKKMMGHRLFAITDAVTETGSGPYQHHLAGSKYECNGVLSGSALSMHQAFKNLLSFAGITIDEALRMCSLYPAQMLHCEDLYGKIAPGTQGQFLVLNEQLEIVELVTS